MNAPLLLFPAGSVPPLIPVGLIALDRFGWLKPRHVAPTEGERLRLFATRGDANKP